MVSWRIETCFKHVGAGTVARTAPDVDPISRAVWAVQRAKERARNDRERFEREDLPCAEPVFRKYEVCCILW